MARKKRPVGRRARPEQTEPQTASTSGISEDSETSSGETEDDAPSDSELSPESEFSEREEEKGDRQADASSESGEDSYAPADSVFPELGDLAGPSLEGDGVLEESGVEDTEHYLKGLVEALLFSSDRPQTSKEIARAARMDKLRVEELIEQLLIETKDRGVRLVEVQEGYAFRTNPIYSPFVREFLAQRPVRLSRAQLETLAIIAYRQPITRPEVDDIRGVDSGGVLKTLLERELIRILGKKDEPGRPMIYGTAPGFLDLFSLNSLRDLPTLREFTELSEDSRAKFEMEIGEPAPEGPIDLDAIESESGDEAASSDESESGDAVESEAEAEGEPKESSEDDAPVQEGDDDASDSSDSDPSPERSESDSPELNPADEEEFPDDEDDEDDEDED